MDECLRVGMSTGFSLKRQQVSDQSLKRKLVIRFFFKEVNLFSPEVALYFNKRIRCRHFVNACLIKEGNKER